MNVKMATKEQLGEVRRDMFMSLAPLYLIASGYAMQAALRDSNVLFGAFRDAEMGLQKVGKSQ